MRLIHILTTVAMSAATAFTNTARKRLVGGRNVDQLLNKRTSTTSLLAASSSVPSIKAQLLQLLLEKTPRNVPTSASLTSEILAMVRQLEEECPTPDDSVLQELAGTWELLWTTQDRSSPESKRLSSWINPLENQSYSNNPGGGGGRSNPVLPLAIQNILEQVGLIDTSLSTITPAAAGDADDANPHKITSKGVTRIVRSTQSVDLTKGEVRNVVAFGLPLLSSLNKKQSRVSLTVLVDFFPDFSNPRRINVKFQSCRVRLPSVGPLPGLDVKIPLGVIGPTGYVKEYSTRMMILGHETKHMTTARLNIINPYLPNLPSCPISRTQMAVDWVYRRFFAHYTGPQGFRICSLSCRL